jgi:hypothetical protein
MNLISVPVHLRDASSLTSRLKENVMLTKSGWHTYRNSTHFDLVRYSQSAYWEDITETSGLGTPCQLTWAEYVVRQSIAPFAI